EIVSARFTCRNLLPLFPRGGDTLAAGGGFCNFEGRKGHQNTKGTKETRRKKTKRNVFFLALRVLRAFVGIPPYNPPRVPSSHCSTVHRAGQPDRRRRSDRAAGFGGQGAGGKLAGRGGNADHCRDRRWREGADPRDRRWRRHSA